MKRHATVADSELVQALEREQIAHGWSDQQMAEHLRISRTLWSLTRRNERHVGGRLIKGAVEAFPLLGPQALIFLQSKVTPRTVVAAHSNGGAE